jgi:hypothetical protein
VELFVTVPSSTTARDVALEVKPRRIRVAARGVVLLAGVLGGEVRAADLGDWEWELGAVDDGDAEAAPGARRVAIMLTKRCVSRVRMRDGTAGLHMPTLAAQRCPFCGAQGCCVRPAAAVVLRHRGRGPPAGGHRAA